MKLFDLSNPPEGATHWDANPNRTPSFMKLENGDWFFWPVCERAEAKKLGWQPWNRSGEQVLKGLTPLVLAWNGEGLPPVGLEVETTDEGRDFKVKILAYADKNGKQAVMVEETEPGNNFGCLFAWRADMCAFRPIRTAEQIAAEEREKGVEEMRRTVAESDRFLVSELQALYDAGYRKLEAGKP